MATNVNRNVPDLFCRYKMPLIVTKVEGKGNGVKTLIINLLDVSKSLNRSPMYILKYFGFMLGAQVHHDKEQHYTISGTHAANKLQDRLDRFIKKYVLCDNCTNPETDIAVDGKIVIIKCSACGYGGVISEYDKLYKYILSTEAEMQPPLRMRRKLVRKEKKKSAAGQLKFCTEQV